eukprot:gene14236-10178_t
MVPISRIMNVQIILAAMWLTIVWAAKRSKSDEGCPEPGGLYLRRGKETARWGTGGWIQRTRASIEFSTGAYFDAQHDSLDSENYGHQLLSADLVDKFLTGRCPLRALVYIYPNDYLKDLAASNEKLVQLNSKIFFGPFHHHEFTPVFANSTILCDSTKCVGWCKRNPHIHCHLLRQCASLTRVAKGLELPRQTRKNVILYLKAHSGVTWNETYIDQIEAAVVAKGFSVQRFVYARYNRADYLAATLNSAFAIIFSPRETAPGYVLELMEANIPIFALTRKSLGAEQIFRDGISGEVADIGTVSGYPKILGDPGENDKPGVAEPGLSLQETLVKLSDFMQRWHEYKPLMDLGHFRFMPYECSSILRELAI